MSPQQADAFANLAGLTVLGLLYAIWPVVGWYIGSQKGKGFDGLLWGALLGPVGVIIIAIDPGAAAPRRRRPCPECREPIDPLARVCPHCRSRLEESKKVAVACAHCGAESLLPEDEVAVGARCPACKRAL